jgi:hypothetical protein
MSATWLGRLPVILFSARVRILTVVSNPISVGIVPIKLTALKNSKDCKLVSSPISVGILPIKFPLGSKKDNSFKFFKIPISEGMQALVLGPTATNRAVIQVEVDWDTKVHAMHNGVDDGNPNCTHSSCCF